MAAKKPADGPVVVAVRRDLKAMPDDVAKSALAASALALAAEIDEASNSATSKSMCAKALHDALDRLREIAPPKQEETDLDRARKRRADRLARLAAPDAASSS